VIYFLLIFFPVLLMFVSSSVVRSHDFLLFAYFFSQFYFFFFFLYFIFIFVYNLFPLISLLLSELKL